MANNVLGILVNLTVRGREQVKGVNEDLKGLTGAAGSAKATIGNFAIGLGAATAAIAGIGIAAKQAWSILQQGAAVDLTRRRFDNLTESIGTTSDTLMSDMRAATSGMVSDMQLMATASELVSLGLTKTHDQTVRMSAVAGQLGWNMQALIMEMNNMTGLRLDALGLQMDQVKAKAKELEAAGMSAKDAWAEAIIQAGEARLGTLGSEAETASGSLKAAAAATADLKNALLESVVATLDQAGAFDALRKSATKLSGFAAFTGEIDRMYKAGELTRQQWAILNDHIRRGGVEAAEAALKQMLMVDALNDTGGATNDNIGAWQTWATSVAIQNQYAADMVRQSSNQMIASAISVQDALAGVTYGPAVPADFARNAALKNWARSSQNRYRMEDSRLDVKEMRGDYERAAAAAYSYGGAVSYALSQEDALAAAHSRMVSAFNAEITARPEDGLINAEGLVNVTAMNDALYEQAQAAGASAVELAMLGIATGKFTKEQAAAALKAAVLQEQIRKVAEGVASGAIKYDAAVGYLEEFRQKLDASGGGAEGATANVEELVSMAQELTSGPYQADINANTTQAQADLQAVLDLIHGISGVHQATVVVDTSGNGPEARALGGPVISGRPYWVGETGPELFIPGGSGGYVVPNNQLGQYQSGGSTLNINITNMVDGRPVGRTQLDDITTDTLMHALRAAGVT